MSMTESRRLGIYLSVYCTTLSSLLCYLTCFEHKEKKRWQGEEEGLFQPREWPLQGRSAWGQADLGAGDLSQDGERGKVVLRPLLS